MPTDEFENGVNSEQTFCTDQISKHNLPINCVIRQWLSRSAHMQIPKHILYLISAPNTIPTELHKGFMKVFMQTLCGGAILHL